MRKLLISINALKDHEMSEKPVQKQAKCEFCGAPVPVIEAPTPILDEDQEAWAAAYQKRLNAARDELMSEREIARAAVEAKVSADHRHQDLADDNANLQKALTKSQFYTWFWFVVTVIMCIMLLS